MPLFQGADTRHVLLLLERDKVHHPDDITITTRRLVLTSLEVDDADEMAIVLSDERLHEFIGGRPATVSELRDRYRKLTTGSLRPEEIWLNWSVRRRSDRQAVGTMQATVTDGDTERHAHVAWVIGVPWQGFGFATEAAQALTLWLCEHDVDHIIAHVHPDHQASAKVAARAGLEPTEDYIEGERVWRSTSHDRPPFNHTHDKEQT